MADSNLYPLAVLIDELRNDDMQLRLHAISKVDTIAVALGPERTRKELVPFLTESVDDEDEILLVLASQLRSFIPLVGGEMHAYALLPALETLANVEEAAVRDEAVNSINAIIAAMPADHVEKYVWPLVHALSKKDWFTSRTSACGLLARLYSRLTPKPAHVHSTLLTSESKTMEVEESGRMEVDTPALPLHQEDALVLFKELCGDSTPMVRRAASNVFAAMASVMAGGRLPAPGPLPSKSGSAGGSSDSKDREEDAATSGAAAGGGINLSSADGGFNVDTGDVTAAAIPPPVPAPVRVSAASPGAAAHAVSILLPLLSAFASDEQDSVRLLAADNVVALLLLLGGATDAPTPAANPVDVDNYYSQVMTIAESLATDRAWRVRWNTANRLGELADALKVGSWTARIVPMFQGLMQDVEAEVRTAASYRVSDIGKLVGKASIVSTMLPSIDRLAEDASEHVRAALASVILGLAPVLGEDTTIRSLLPLFLRLLKDPSPQVRLNIISKLEAVNAVIGLRTLSESLLPAISELSSDKQWRVRLAIIEFMPILAKQLGADFFNAELTDLCVGWLMDHVFSIREAAANNLRKLTLVFGSAWASTTIIPRITALSGTYKQRMTALNAALVVASATDREVLQGELLAFILRFGKDPVPNIRFNVAKGLERLMPKFDVAVRSGRVADVLNQLASDTERDVVYFATRALAAATSTA